MIPSSSSPSLGSLARLARKSPVFAGGIRLDTDAGWDAMMDAVAQVLDLLALAAKMAELGRGEQQQLMQGFKDNLLRKTEQQTG